MRLLIENPNELNLDDFCSYLIGYIAHIQLKDLNLNAKLVSKWSQYLHTVFPIDFPSNADVSFQNFIEQFLRNQIYTKGNGYYAIEVNNNIKIEGIRIERVVQTVEAGALDIKGYPLFTNIYKQIAKQLPLLYSNWGSGQR